MPANRFYTPRPLVPFSSLSLSGPEFHHLCHVMRIQLEEQVELVNGLGELGYARVVSIKEKHAELFIDHCLKMLPSEHSITLAQALPHFKKLEWIIEKGTELGVAEFFLFPGEESEKKSLSTSQIDRLKILMITALKQSGNLFLPQLSLHPSIFGWDPSVWVDRFSFYGAPFSKKFLSYSVAPLFRTTLFNGPEKGFTSKEIKHLHLLHAHPVQWHHHILRCETAAIVGIAQLYLSYKTQKN